MMVGGTLIGIEAGARLIMHLEKQFVVDTVVTYSYIGLLASIFLIMFLDLMSKNKKNDVNQEPHQKKGMKILDKIQNLKLPPMIYFPKANVTRSFLLWFI